MNNPTIAAISTPMSAGAIGLVRMSGPDDGGNSFRWV